MPLPALPLPARPLPRVRASLLRIPSGRVGRRAAVAVRLLALRGPRTCGLGVAAPNPDDVRAALGGWPLAATLVRREPLLLAEVSEPVHLLLWKLEPPLLAEPVNLPLLATAIRRTSLRAILPACLHRQRSQPRRRRQPEGRWAERDRKPHCPRRCRG